MKWMPDRKILAGGLTMIVSWFGLRTLGVEDLELVTMISGALTIAMQYLVPSSVRDIISKIDKDIADVVKSRVDSASHDGATN